MGHQGSLGNSFCQRWVTGVTENEMPNEVVGISSDVLTLRDLADDDELWVGDTGASRHMGKT